ncbi:hypothetical protein PoB_003094000 [Plakobranchus ocellatus]|uniref:Uncharacterized protein n=1 Tax=Plakobranchus ocellatus TaxID=259542 RepID=A0AAV4A8D9_9GAST|nr:hypothetical protein PoB_003094000 [Plakobranchus ocellatus]
MSFLLMFRLLYIWSDVVFDDACASEFIIIIPCRYQALLDLFQMLDQIVYKPHQQVADDNKWTVGYSLPVYQSNVDQACEKQAEHFKGHLRVDSRLVRELGTLAGMRFWTPPLRCQDSRNLKHLLVVLPISVRVSKALNILVGKFPLLAIFARMVMLFYLVLATLFWYQS